MATANHVRDGAAALAAYHATLEQLVAEPAAAGHPDGTARRHPDPPFPGNAPAFAALMVIWEAVPRLEAALRLAVDGHPGPRRGGSPGNFTAALTAAVRLSGGLTEDGEAQVARVLDRLADLARVVPDIDEAQRWRPVRGRACPYCGCLTSLRVLLDARGGIAQPARVECFAGPRANGDRCADGDGYRPAATMGADEHGRPVLEWADGLTETAAESLG